MFSCDHDDLTDPNSELRLLLKLHEHSLKLAEYTTRRMTCRVTKVNADKDWRQHYERLIGHEIDRIDGIREKLKNMEERHWHTPLRTSESEHY